MKNFIYLMVNELPNEQKSSDRLTSAMPVMNFNGPIKAKLNIDNYSSLLDMFSSTIAFPKTNHPNRLSEAVQLYNLKGFPIISYRVNEDGTFPHSHMSNYFFLLPGVYKIESSNIIFTDLMI